MITFKDNGSAVSIQFSDEQRYLYDGEMNVPKGSLSLVYDNSGMAIFKRSSNNDVLFECFPSDTNLGNESALTEFFTNSMVGEGVDLSDYYTKEEADAAIESAITESGNITSGQVESQIESALTAYTTTTDLNALLNNKQDTLVSGTNIKTINNQSILGSGNIAIEGGGNSYTAGNGITIAEGVISVDSGVVPSIDEVVDNDTYTAFTASTSSDISNLEKQDTALGGEIASHEQAFTAYTAATNATLANKADKSEIPSLDGYATESWVEGKGYVTNADMTAYTTTSDLNALLNNKQDTLVSGTNIKTINNQSLLGEGNIDIQGGGGASYTAGEGIEISEANEISVDEEALAIPTLQTEMNGSSSNYIYSKYVSQPLYDVNVSDSIPKNCVLGYPKVWRTASSFKLEFNTYNDSNIGFGGNSEFIVTDEYAGFMKATDKVKLDSIPEGSAIALKSEIPSLEGYLTKSSGDTIYQPIGDYVTGAEMTAYTYSKSDIDSMIGDVETLLSQI